MSKPDRALWRLWLLFTAFAKLATACLPPLNDFSYLDNATLFEDAVAQCDTKSAMG